MTLDSLRDEKKPRCTLLPYAPIATPSQKANCSGSWRHLQQAFLHLSVTAAVRQLYNDYHVSSTVYLFAYRIEEAGRKGPSQLITLGSKGPYYRCAWPMGPTRAVRSWRPAWPRSIDGRGHRASLPGPRFILYWKDLQQLVTPRTVQNTKSAL